MLPDLTFLQELLATPSPTGFEMPGQRVWANFIQPHCDQVVCDTYGSTWAIKRGTSDRVLMLAAHADEIGYMVKHIDDNGYLWLDRIGGSDVATARGRRLHILTENGAISGVIGNTAIHLRRGNDEEKVPAIHELWVDVGANSPEEVSKLGIRIGQAAVYQEALLEMPPHRLVSRALDNRISSYILAQVLKRLASREISFTLVCLNAIQEEIGGHGAIMATYEIQPELAICLDVTHATDTPGLEYPKVGKVELGKGPTLTHGTANHPKLVSALEKIAQQHDVPLQHEASSRYTGTDTDSIFISRRGVASALVSIPLRNMHSVVETADSRDVEQTITLLCEFILSLNENSQFSQSLPNP